MTLDDTQGYVSLGQMVFEEAPVRSESDSYIVGRMIYPGSTTTLPVYNTSGLGPDVSELSSRERAIWVQASSVYSKEKII